MATTTVWVRFEFSGDGHAEAADVIDRLLDAGAMQDAIEEAGADTGTKLITVTAITTEPEVAVGRGVPLTKRQACAAAAAVAAMLAGEGPAEGDWPEEVTHRDMTGAAAKLGVR